MAVYNGIRLGLLYVNVNREKKSHSVWLIALLYRIVMPDLIRHPRRV